MQARFQQDQAEMDQAWRRALEETGIARVDLPCHSVAVGEARANWHVRRSALAEEVSRLESWMQALQKPDADLRTELIDQARILAIPMSRPTGLSPAQNKFSWIILDDADQATEQDVLDLASRGSHLILLGDPQPAPSSPTSPFQRLWHRLQEETRGNGVRCGDFANRLAFTLRNLPLEHHAFLQREPLFDRPEIELGIVSLPGQEPCIAEVLFPDKLAIAEAKQFVYRELQQLPLQTDEANPRWVEGQHTIRLLFMREKSEATLVELEPGVRERVVLRRKDGSKEYGCWHTQSLEFDRRAGWDQQRVRAWLNSFLQGGDPSRIFDLMPINGASRGGAKSQN
ncbi:MAG: hypothetical protein ACKO23_14010, partial [Gemmataceae bacterium]